MINIVNTSGVNGPYTDFTSISKEILLNDNGDSIVGTNSFIPVGVASGSAAIPVSQSGNWSVSANITNPNIPVTQSGTWTVNSLQPSGEVYTVGYEITSYDAFGRFRVSEPYSLFDSKLVVTSDSEVWSRATGGSGTQIHYPNQAMEELKVFASGDYAIAKTFQSIPYLPGKSQLVIESAYNFQSESGIIKRIGYFTTSYTAPYYSGQDGIWWQSDPSGISVCIANRGVVEQYYQNDWNYDKMDGSGVSGKTIDWSLNQIYAFQFQWMGFGRVAFGLGLDKFYPVTVVEYSNETSGVYMSSPNKPVRYDIYSIGGSGTLNEISCSVETEGGSQPRYIDRVVENAETIGVAGPIKDIAWGLLGVRLVPSGVGNSDSLDVFVETIETMTSTANANGGWDLRINPNVSGTYTWIQVPNCSGLQYAVGSATNLVSGGLKIHKGLYSNAISSHFENVDTNSRIGTSISGTTQELWLCGFNTVNNAIMYANLDLKIVV